MKSNATLLGSAILWAGLAVLIVPAAGCGEGQPKVMMPEHPVPPPKPGTLKQHSSASQASPQGQEQPQQQTN